jgi:hypothetical protein
MQSLLVSTVRPLVCIELTLSHWTDTMGSMGMFLAGLVLVSRNR